MYEPALCNCDASASANAAAEAEAAANAAAAEEENRIEIPETLPAAPKELTEKINKNLLEDRVLIVATANYGMRNHVYNWIESLRLTGEEKFLIFCFDQKLLEHLTLAGYGDRASLIPEVWFHQQVEADFKTYFSQEYRVITHSKTLVVQQLLYLDINVFFSDVDIVWLRPRLVEYVNTFLQIRPETHVLFQQEGLNQQEINSGFYLMRPTTEMKRLLAETIHIQDTVEGKTQQGSMNSALNNLNMDLRTTSVVLLDVLHFPNGFVYYNHDLPNKHGIKPFIVHANYLVGEEKKQKLKESNFWYIKDSWLNKMDAKLERELAKKGAKKAQKTTIPEKQKKAAA
ncbi:nucleotide-diphospho-sugar transferase-domain-containing protein [Mucor mucedo]|uniref:nucleotide-diphospho-sugar transferase-domain-containing protein n=1 Tax=Mucor mucedo TaxID=29922 RepID=UPI00221EB200|nr:nucleotide-diphospho-sugar transferase-domain-containing protein [Mucor mucedo]KAI7889407.1 nucleotide-diphospho-sugar transferase-domain-containing protein [Mucor mucedo]